MEISERDYDLLVDTEIVVDVMLGSTSGEIYVNTRIIGTGDIIVIDDKLAVRVQDSMDSDNVVRYFFEEHMI
jgi:flagellar motor switch protein FliN/FliY